VARTPEDYEKIALNLANDLNRLSELRQTLRETMLSSPLMDAKSFAKDVEQAYRQIWREWSAQLQVPPFASPR
jgi:predicted O-linked N-acetylglucosamine transferase (SPINDLY family)